MADLRYWSALVACSDALPGAIQGSEDASYGPTGQCWRGTAADADKCTAQCQRALASEQTQSNPPAACK